MILSEKAGIVTNYSEGKTKAGKKMIIISHTVGNSENLQKIFVFEDDENFMPEIGFEKYPEATHFRKSK